MQDYRRSQGQQRGPYQPNQQGGNRGQNDAPRPPYTQAHPINPVWITQEAKKEMVTYADAVGKKIKNLSSSQIRNIYGEMKRIQVKGFDAAKASFYLLKPKVAYAYGRALKGTRPSEEMKTFKEVFDAAFDCVTDARTYDNFCNFIEAILAYHKFHGGK